jgi:hypothetical protein
MRSFIPMEVVVLLDSHADLETSSSTVGARTQKAEMVYIPHLENSDEDKSTRNGFVFIGRRQPLVWRGQ